MTKLARVTVTVPNDVLKAADRLADRLDRSRSWVVSEALRRYAGGEAGESPAGGGKRAGGGERVGVRERIATPYPSGPGLDEQRRVQLEADLQLTPEQRVHEAEETVQLAQRLHTRPRAAQVLAFQTYEDFLEWRERDLLW